MLRCASSKGFDELRFINDVKEYYTDADLLTQQTYRLTRSAKKSGFVNLCVSETETEIKLNGNNYPKPSLCLGHVQSQTSLAPTK